MRKRFIYLEAQIEGYHRNLFYSFWEMMETIGFNFDPSEIDYIDIIDRLIDSGNVVVGEYYITLDNQNADNLEILQEAKKQILKWKKFPVYKKENENEKMIRIRELLKEIGGLSLHGHRNEGKWHGQEAELKDYEEFEELESLIEKQNELLTLSLQLNDVWRNRFNYNNSESYIMSLEERIKKLKGEIK
jgi:hypothetical protein